MICVMFPGQPMARTDMPATDPAFVEMARCCEDETGFNPLTDSVTVSHLTESIRLQLFGTTMSLYRFNLLVQQGEAPDVIAEHSMGIYPALVACGAVDSAVALALTSRIGVCLAGMGESQDYAVGSVIGLALAPLVTVAANHGVYVANHNTSRHFLLSGERRLIESAVVEAEAAGAFSARVFPCDAPLHTPLVEAVAHDLRRIVAEYTFREPRVPLVGHLSQSWLTAAAIPLFLVDELCQPVFWEQTYRALRGQGIDRFQEVGTGSALTKFNRWIDSEP